MKSLFTSTLLVDFVLRFWQHIPAPVMHNLEKAHAIKKIFWHLNVDQFEGCYIEFGVAHGYSMRSAEIAESNTHSKVIGVKRIPRNLFGFDTFESFQSNAQIDSHPTWEGTLFNVPLSQIQNRFSSSKNIKFIKMDVTRLIGDSGKIVDSNDLGISEKAAIILFDMDLYEPTFSALCWSRQLMQTGTFILFDEFFAFGGDSNKGEARALREFLNLNAEVRVRDYASYGAGGKIFIVEISE